MECVYKDKDGVLGLTGVGHYVEPRYSNSGIDYTIEFDRFLFNILPTIYRPYKDGSIWRRLKLFKFISVVYGQLQLLYDSDFLVFRKDQLYLSNVNCQTIVLEKYLRDRFSNCNILIKNNFTQADVLYLFNREEVQQGIKNFIYNPSEVNPDQIYLYNGVELTPEYDVSIWVPAYIIDSGLATEDMIRSIVNQWVYSTIKFNIIKY